MQKKQFLDFTLVDCKREKVKVILSVWRNRGEQINLDINGKEYTTLQTFS